MGLLSRLTGATKTADITAQYAPQVLGEYSPYAMPFQFAYVGRTEALGVPALARCRNLLAGTIGTIPLMLHKKSTGEMLGSPLWLDQPSYHQPRSVTIAYTVDSLLFYGQAFWQVIETYQEDGRPSRFDWIANSRVTATLDRDNVFVKSYAIDGTTVPMDGLGSLITFQSLNDGILNTGVSTIRAALDIQKAAAVAASTPMPTGYLKNSGADLPPAEVQGLLAAFKNARLNRSTAYLTSTLDYQTVGFSPKDMMYNEASQYLATQIARAMNVPAYYISADMNNSMTYQNIIDGRKEFVAYSLQPYICAIEDRLSMNDITAAGQIVRFNISETFLRSDDKARLETLEKMLTLGLIDLDQAKEMEDLTPNGNESGDVTYVQ